MRATVPSASTATALSGLAASTALTALSVMSKSFQLRSNPEPSAASTEARLSVPFGVFPVALAGSVVARTVASATATTQPSRAMRRAIMGEPSVVG